MYMIYSRHVVKRIHKPDRAPEVERCTTGSTRVCFLRLNSVSVYGFIYTYLRLGLSLLFWAVRR